MKKILVLLGVAILFSFGSCKKKAADMIIGNWILYQAGYYDYESQPEDFQREMIWEFGADGTLRFETSEGVAEGSYNVDGSNIKLRYRKKDTHIYNFDGIITDMHENSMSWNYSSLNMQFYRTNESIAETPSQTVRLEWNGRVFYDGETVTCTNDENGSGDLVQHIQIRNRTDEAKSFLIEQEVIQGVDGVTYSISTNRVSVSAQSVNDEELSFHALYEDQVYGFVEVKYYVYEENHSDEQISLTVRYNRFSGNISEGATISVTGDCWFVLDHQYFDGETIYLENATFGLYGAADDARHQQLISGGDGERLRIGQAGLIWTNYSYVYFNMDYGTTNEDSFHYGHTTSVAGGYILNNADIVFSPSSLWIDGILVTSYETRHCYLNTNMCLFANSEDGWDSVQGQTAALGTVTITDAYGDVTAKYIPMLDENRTPCFYNPVSGAYIYHSGSGTPIYHPGF